MLLAWGPGHQTSLRLSLRAGDELGSPEPAWGSCAEVVLRCVCTQESFTEL